MSIRTDIIALLRSQILQSINFNIGGKVIVRGTDYSTIATCIQNGHIQIVFTRADVGRFCAYNHQYNCFIVGSRWSENTIVHEAIHAANDWHKRVMTALDDEAGAYIAQAMYLFLINPAGWFLAKYNPNLEKEVENRLKQAKTLDRTCTPTAVGQKAAVAVAAMQRGDLARLFNANAFLAKCSGQIESSTRAIVGEAAMIAINLLDGVNVQYRELGKLHQALWTSPAYKPLLGSKARLATRSLGGILHVNIPAAYLQQIQGTVVQN